MKLEINENENYLFEMANVLGRKVKVPHKLLFLSSFHLIKKLVTL